MKPLVRVLVLAAGRPRRHLLSSLASGFPVTVGTARPICSVAADRVPIQKPVAEVPTSGPVQVEQEGREARRKVPQR